MSKLFNTLRDVLTPYANKINLHSEEIEEIQGDVEEIQGDVSDVKDDLADATGLISVEWEQGAIVGNTGELVDNDARIRTTDSLDDRIETLSIESGYEFALCAWNGDTYIGQWNRTNKVWTKGTLYASASINLSEIRESYNGYSYKVVARKSNNTSIAVSESNNFSYYPFSEVDLNSKDIETVYAKLSSTEALIDAGYSESKIQGGFVLGDTGNGSLIVSSTNNMVTSDVQTVADDCVLTTDWSKYKIYIWQVENNTWNGLGWFFADHTLLAGFSGRFVVRGVTTHDFTAAEQEEINNVTVYARTTTLKNRIDSIDIGKSDFISICHQGYSDSMSTNQNLLSGFKAASEKGFEYAETDVALSSNSVVMCCHDSSFVDATTGDTIVIAEHTDVELKTYNYYGGTIATLDEIMLACKTNRIGLVIDHATGSLLPYIYPIVSKYGMQDSVIYLIGWAVGNENYAKNMYNSIIAFYKRSKVMFMAGTSSLSEVKTFLNTLDTGFATVYITLNHANYPVADIITLTQELPGEITVAVWTIDNLPTAKSYMPYVTAITSNKYSSRDIFT